MNASHFTNESSIDRTMWLLMAGLAMLLFVMISVAGFSSMEQSAERATSTTGRMSQQQRTADFGMD